jgi:hypothetical protein
MNWHQINKIFNKVFSSLNIGRINGDAIVKEFKKHYEESSNTDTTEDRETSYRETKQSSYDNYFG